MKHFSHLIDSTILYVHIHHKFCKRLMYLLTYTGCVKWKITLCILVGQSVVNMPKYVVWSPVYVFVFVTQEEEFV